MNRKMGTLISFALIAAFGILVIYLSLNKEASLLYSNPYGLRYIASEEAPVEYIKSQMDICRQRNSNECQEQLAGLFMDQFEYKKLLTIIEENQNYPEIFSKCHELVHYVGRNAYKNNPDIKSLYEHSAPTCWGGFYHGVIEGHFDQNKYKGDEEFAREIRDVCGTSEDYSVPHFFFECLHGIGHAMMFVSSGDLIKSLAWCDELGNQSSQNTCYSGVFMENSSSSTAGSMHTSSYIKAEDPMYPCNAIPEKYLEICYSYQSSYFAQLVNWDWKKNGDLCSQVPASYQAGCFRIIGSNQVGSTKTTKDMASACELMPSEETKKLCFYGVLSGLSGRYINEPEIIGEFCSQLEEKYKQGCFTTMGSTISSWSATKESVRVFCETGTPEYTKWCNQGLNSDVKASFITN